MGLKAFISDAAYGYYIVSISVKSLEKVLAYCKRALNRKTNHQRLLNTKVTGGVPWDPTSVFCIFYYYHVKFFDRYFYVIVTFMDTLLLTQKKKIKSTPSFSS